MDEKEYKPNVLCHMRYKGLRCKLKGEKGRVRWKENKVEDREYKREKENSVRFR